MTKIKKNMQMLAILLLFLFLSHVLAILLLFLFLSPASSVYATPDGWLYGQHVIYVNEQRFEVWGYRLWDEYGNYRLRDIAYILNGTSAQFNIWEPLGAHLHFWIERNVPYEPIGTELTHFYEEHLEWRQIGGFHAYAGQHLPLQHVILSMDGSFVPEVNTVVTVLTSFGFPINEPARLVDLNQVYFAMENLAGLLGFRLEMKSGELHITTGIEYLSDNIAPHSLKLMDMDISFRLTGHWVDGRFFDSDIINQEVAWPHEFEIGLFGLTYQPRFVDFQFTGLPLSARQPNIWHHYRDFFSLTALWLETGRMTIFVNDTDRKISVDLNSMPINTLIYYVDGIPHEMVRLDSNLSPGRYRYEAHKDGGIHLTYIADFQSFWSNPEYIHIYRSNVQGYEGERIYTHMVIDENDRIFFEFIDPHAEPSRIYFYTIKSQGRWNHYNVVTFGGERQITAYVAYVPEDVTITEDNDIFNFDLRLSSSGWNVLALVIVIAFVIGIIARIFILRRKRV